MAEFVHRIEEFAHEHPMATVGIGLATVAIVFWLSSGSDPAPAQTVVQQRAPDTTGAAAALAATQAQTQAQTAQATIAASTATTLANIAAAAQGKQSDDALAAQKSKDATTTALATIAGNTSTTNTQIAANTALSTSKLAAATAISQSQIAAQMAAAHDNTVMATTLGQANILAGVQKTAYMTASATSIAQAQSAALITKSNNDLAATTSGNATLASEFANLAALIGAHGAQQTAALTAITGNAAGVINNSSGVLTGLANSELTTAKQITNTRYINDDPTGIYGAGYAGYTDGFGTGKQIVAKAQDQASATLNALAPTTAAAALNTSVNTAANALGTQGMNALISQLSAKIGNGVAFHT